MMNRLSVYFPPDVAVLEHLFDLLLVLVRIHGFEESVMMICIQFPPLDESGQHILFQVIALPLIEYLEVEYKKTGVYPVFIEHRLLLETYDFPGRIKIDGTGNAGGRWSLLPVRHGIYGRR